MSPSLNQIPLPGVDCYTSNLGLDFTKGYGIQGSNFAQGLALTQFSTDTSSGTSTISLINTDTISNPGTSSIAGTIKGDDGSSGSLRRTIRLQSFHIQMVTEIHKILNLGAL